MTESDYSELLLPADKLDVSFNLLEITEGTPVKLAPISKFVRIKDEVRITKEDLVNTRHWEMIHNDEAEAVKIKVDDSGLLVKQKDGTFKVDSTSVISMRSGIQRPEELKKAHQETADILNKKNLGVKFIT